MAKIYSLKPESVKIYNDLIAAYRGEEQFYKAASIWCDNEGYKIPFFVDLMHYMHHRAHRIERKLTDTGTLPALPDIKAIQPKAAGLISLINEGYERAYKLCEMLNDDVKMAGDDVKTVNHLCKYVAKQEDIVNKFAEMLKRLKGVDESNRGMLMMLIKKIFS